MQGRWGVMRSYSAVSSTSSFRSRQSRFLPFEKARDCVRALGFTARKDYHNFWKSERPQYLPCCPHEVYRKKWIDYPDFCNFSRHKRFVDPRLLKQTKQDDHFLSRANVRASALYWFSNLCEDYVKNFEFEPVVSAPQVSFLCRKKGSTTDE